MYVKYLDTVYERMNIVGNGEEQLFLVTSLLGGETLHEWTTTWHT